MSLNPALAGNGGSSIFTALSYDPLIYLSGAGNLVPDLATSWKYVGADNKVFDISLRSGVKFTDGSAMTADAVAASMNYFLTSGSSAARQVGSVTSVKATDASTVEVTYSVPNPNAAATLTQFTGFGTIIGPKGLANPASLLTSSDGTGAYIYDPSTSIASSHYDYKINPGYFNPSAQMYDAVSVRIIGDPNAVLSAAQTGQVDFAGGSAGTAAAAQQAGLTVLKAPFFNWSLILADRAGEVSKPLADDRVRQAIAYALDRTSLASAVGGGFATASTQVMLPGTDGYVANYGYSHDLAKAKSLMAAAGYANGFPLTILTESIIDSNTTYSQAIAGQLEAIGIKVTLKVEATGIAQFGADSTSKKYAAVIFPSAGTDMFSLANQILSPGLFNPFGSSDPQVSSLLQQAYSSDGAARTALYQQVSKRLGDLAWVVPVISTPTIEYVGKNVANVTASVLNPNPLPTAPQAALAWHHK